MQLQRLGLGSYLVARLREGVHPGRGNLKDHGNLSSHFWPLQDYDSSKLSCHFKQNPAGNHRETGEVPRLKRFIGGERFYAGDALAGNELRHAIDEQERITMRKERLNFRRHHQIFDKITHAANDSMSLTTRAPKNDCGWSNRLRDPSPPRIVRACFPVWSRAHPGNGQPELPETWAP